MYFDKMKLVSEIIPFTKGNESAAGGMKESNGRDEFKYNIFDTV
jgi:hypothetical protein